MKLQIKKSVFSSQIISEGNAVLAKIRNKNLFSPAKIITDQDGKAVFTTDIVNSPASSENWNNTEPKKYVVYQNRQPVATATFSFAQNSERTKIQVFTLRPPKVDTMDVETSYGVWNIKRQKDNSIIITSKDKILGTITAFFSFKKIYLEHFTNYDPTFWAGIYVLVEYMMHEDDLIVV